MSTATAEIRHVLEQERLRTRRAIWQAITKKVPAPDRLTDVVGLTWLELIHLLDEEGVVTR